MRSAGRAGTDLERRRAALWETGDERQSLSTRDEPGKHEVVLGAWRKPSERRWQ